MKNKLGVGWNKISNTWKKRWPIDKGRGPDKSELKKTANRIQKELQIIKWGIRRNKIRKNIVEIKRPNAQQKWIPEIRRKDTRRPWGKEIWPKKNILSI